MTATLLPDRYDIIGKRLLFLGGSSFLVLLSVALLFFKGLNLGVDFAGGVLLETKFSSSVKAEDLRKLFLEQTGEKVSVQSVGNSPKQVLLRAPAKAEEMEAGANPAERYKTALTTRYPDVTFLKAEYVGPKVGNELYRAGAIAFSLSLLGIMVYIWARFEWQYALGGALALFHDALITLGFYSLTGVEFDLSSVAALLTVIGYSINDSVVIYDRIRENFRRFKHSEPTKIINGSIIQTLSRTLLTAATTLVALAVLAVFGGSVVAGFSYAAFIGIMVGTYSSIYVSAPMLIYFDLRPEEAS